MDQEIKEKWIKELRSEKHRQAQMALKVRNGAMCCLGVLEHKVLGKEYEWDGENYINESGGYEWPSSQTKSECKITNEEEDVICDLVEMNDEGKPFDRIADHIESNL